MHFLRQRVDLPPCIAEDDSLSDSDSLVEITQRIQLPLLLLHSNIELLDTLEGQLVPLDENPNGVTHELLRHFQHIGRHSGGQQDDLGVLCVICRKLISIWTGKMLKTPYAATTETPRKSDP